MGWQKKPQEKKKQHYTSPPPPQKDLLGVMYVKDKVGEQVGLGRESLRPIMQTLQNLGQCNGQLLSKHCSYSSLH